MSDLSFDEAAPAAGLKGRSPVNTRYHHPFPADLDDREPTWDAFAGPAALLPDDRHSPVMQPLVLAARTLAFSLEINGRILKGLADGPRPGSDRSSSGGA